MYYFAIRRRHKMGHEKISRSLRLMKQDIDEYDSLHVEITEKKYTLDVIQREKI